MVGFIYKYENKINHKVYIGQTTDLVSRKASHRHKSAFVKNKFYNAIRKYGWDNFDFDIIAQIEETSLENITKTLDELEVYFINKYDSMKNGYNSTGGGHCYRGRIVSDEYREYCKNRTYSEETRRKMSIAASNRVVSDETREKCRINAIKRNAAFNLLQYKEKRQARLKEVLSKPVLQLDKCGNLINEFPSVKKAALFIVACYAQNKTLSGIEHGVRRHCVGETKKRFYYGFEWRFKPIV